MTRGMRTDSSTPFAGHSSGAQAQLRPIECRVFEDFTSVEELRDSWDAAVGAAGGSVYMTFDWVRVWWSFYGRAAELRLYVFFSAGEIAALVPLYIETVGGGPLRMRVARLIGANIPPKVFNPPVPEWCADRVFRIITEDLLLSGRSDVLSYGPVSETHESTSSLRRICEGDLSGILKCEIAQTIHTIFHLPRDMEEYYAGLSKNERKNRRKYELRRLKKDHETAVEVIEDPALVSEAFEHFRKQHTQQWKSEGRTGHFGAWPDALDFNRRLVEAHGRLGRLRFVRLVADGKVIADQYVFAFGDRYYWELPSRETDSYWDPFSLGPTAIVTMISAAIAEGMTCVEGGLAHYDYKLRLGAREYDALTYRFIAPGLRSRIKVAFFAAIRSVTRVGYQALWYRRMVPRLPSRFWHPQWRFWLKMDF